MNLISTYRYFVLMVITLFGVMHSPALFGQCNHGVVKAVAQKGQNAYIQYGVGILFQLNSDQLSHVNKPKTLNIIIPQHVISGADKIYLICDRQEFPISNLKGSILSDLAIGNLQLESHQVNLLSPQFKFTDVNHAGYLNLIDIQTQILKFASLNADTDEFNRRDVYFLTPRLNGPSTKTMVSSLTLKRLAIDSPLSGDYGSIITSTGATPGMSGSGLYISNKLIGIVSKTLFGDSLSAVIPLAEIVSAIREYSDPLAKEKDKRGDEQLVRQENRTNLESTYEQELLKIGVTISEIWSTQERHFKLKVNHLEFSDLCVQPSYLYTSNWELQGSGGGWGEGGSSNKHFLQISGTDVDTNKNINLILNNKPRCQDHNEGVELSDGRILVALRTEDGSLFEIHSTEDLFSALRLYGQKFTDYLNSNGIFKNNSPFKAFCQTNSFGHNSPKCAQEHKIYRVKNGDLFEPNILLKATTLNECYFTQFTPNFTCDEFKDEIRFRDEGDLSLNSPFDFDLRFKTETVSGYFKLGECELKMKDWPSSLWTTYLTSDDFDVLIEKGSNFNGHGYFLVLPLRIDKKCQIDPYFKGAQWIIQN